MDKYQIFELGVNSGKLQKEEVCSNLKTFFSFLKFSANTFLDKLNYFKAILLDTGEMFSFNSNNNNKNNFKMKNYLESNN